MATRRTAEKVRELDAQSLGVAVADPTPRHVPEGGDDVRLTEVRALLKTYGGVIFSGPPGTSKSWNARRVATALANNDPKRITFLQFHPSYQYEDFMQGIVPRGGEEVGFEIVDRPFVRMCRLAGKDPANQYVIVIDELSRGDPGRVFGEALTYIERSKRGESFELSLGDEIAVPENLVILATMNPQDRGVDEVDAAFERRFAKIAMEPDASVLAQFLDENGVVDPLRKRVLSFFGKVNALSRRNPLAAVGQTFFIEASDEASLQRLWDYQLQFLFEKAFRLNPDAHAEVVADWHRLFRVTEEADAAETQQQDSAEDR